VAARLEELGAGEAAAELSVAAAAAAAERAALQEARALQPMLAAAAAPVALARAARLVLFFPAQPGTGAGAVLDAASALRARVPADASVEVVVGDLPADAEMVVQGVGLRPQAPPPAASAWLSTGALLALGAVFAVALVSSLRSLRQQALAASARADFLTSVTHELRTPLSSLRLFSEMLADGRVEDAGRRREYYRLMAGEALRLSALIDNVLDLGRMERGERGYDWRELDLAALVQETVTLFAPLAERDGMRVELALEAARAPVRGDRAALAQALLNVLDNGRKYAAAGQRLEVEVRAAEAAVSATVRDFGPGVPLAEREAVFARFVRGAQQRDGHVPGVGLGLYLARRIARAHGGDLACSEPAGGGRGVVFSLTLPRLSPAGAANGRAPQEEHA
jgi:signal transduction histidine kinase